jgi:hypothetical protein
MKKCFLSIHHHPSIPIGARLGIGSIASPLGQMAFQDMLHTEKNLRIFLVYLVTVQH